MSATNARAPDPDPFALLTLAGMAESYREGQTLRTAIIAGPGDVFWMAECDEVFAGRYKVTRIGPDVVELADIETSRLRGLALR